MDYHFNFNYIWRHFDRLWHGLILSLELAFISILIGMMIGLVLALVYTGGGRTSRAMVAAYVEFIRNVPLLLTLDRLRVHIYPATAKVTAWNLASALASGNPPVIVRDHHAENGFLDLDPSNLHDGEAEIVADQIGDALERGLAGQILATRLPDRRAGRFERMLAWPD